MYIEERKTHPMKTIGLLGGTSYVSTPNYYLKINELISQKLGGFHSAKVILKSIDYHEIKSKYDGKRHEIAPILKKEMLQLQALGPDCIILCNNSLHEALDESGFEQESPVPFFHAPRLTAQCVAEEGIEKILLLGTEHTMRGAYYQAFFTAHNTEVIIPNDQDIQQIADIQKRVATGVVSAAGLRELSENFMQVIAKYPNAGAAILACTELPLLVTENSPLPLIDPAEIQCRKAVDFVLGW